MSEAFGAKGRWVLPAGLAISGGVLTKTVAPDGVTSHLATLYVPRILSGRLYRVTFTSGGRSAGGVTPRLGSTGGTIRNANGTHVEEIVAGPGGTLGILFSANANSGMTVDNIVVQEL